MKTFYLGGPTWMFLIPDQMYGEDGKLRAAHHHYKNADIYFITKMCKIRFDTRQTRVTSDGQIQTTIIVGDPSGEHKTYRFVFPHIYTLYSVKHIAPQFESVEHFFKYTLCHYYRPQSRLSRAAYKFGRSLATIKALSSLGFTLMNWAYAREVKISHKTAYEITIDDPLLRSIVNNAEVEQMKTENPEVYRRQRELHDADWDTERLKKVDFSQLPGGGEALASRLTVDQVINIFDVDVGVQEILYIGKTNREPFERLLPHEKLQELESKFLRNDGESLIVHLFGFKKIDIANGTVNQTKLKKEDATSACEAELINYFKPAMNSDYVKDTGKSNWDYIRKMRANKYQQILVELDIDGQYTKFASTEAGISGKNKHAFIVNLSSLVRQVH